MAMLNNQMVNHGSFHSVSVDLKGKLQEIWRFFHQILGFCMACHESCGKTVSTFGRGMLF